MWKFQKQIRELKSLKGFHIFFQESSFLNIYKSFIRPHLEYRDVIYDQPNNKSFCSKIEWIQYNAALAITGAMRGTSQSKLYNELGLKSLKFRRWFRQLCTFF